MHSTPKPDLCTTPSTNIDNERRTAASKERLLPLSQKQDFVGVVCCSSYFSYSLPSSPEAMLPVKYARLENIATPSLHKAPPALPFPALNTKKWRRVRWIHLKHPDELHSSGL